MFRRLWWLPGRSSGAGSPDGRVLGLERDLREARLDIAQRDGTIERLTTELRRLRDAAEAESRQRTQAELERFVEAIAPALVQFATQAHLHGGGAQVRVDDVLAVGSRLRRSLRDVGVDLIGDPGEVTEYDPGRHAPLSAAAAPLPGQPVVVRMVGLVCRDHVVRRAGVDPVDAGES